MTALWDEKTLEMEMETALMIEDLRAANDRIKSASMRAQVAYMDDQPKMYCGLVRHYHPENSIEWHIMGGNMAAILRTQTVSDINMKPWHDSKNEITHELKVTVRGVLFMCFIKSHNEEYFKRLVAGAVYVEGGSNNV